MVATIIHEYHYAPSMASIVISINDAVAPCSKPYNFDVGSLTPNTNSTSKGIVVRRCNTEHSRCIVQFVIQHARG